MAQGRENDGEREGVRGKRDEDLHREAVERTNENARERERESECVKERERARRDVKERGPSTIFVSKIERSNGS